MLKQALQLLSPQPVLGFPNVHSSCSSAQPLLPKLTDISKISPPGRRYWDSINDVTHSLTAYLFACQYISHGITTTPPNGAPVVAVTIKECPSDRTYGGVRTAFATHGLHMIRRLL
jgi:hypothetical protein